MSAEVENNTYMYGLHGYFHITKELKDGTKLCGDCASLIKGEPVKNVVCAACKDGTAYGCATKLYKGTLSTNFGSTYEDTNFVLKKELELKEHDNVCDTCIGKLLSEGSINTSN